MHANLCGTPEIHPQGMVGMFLAWLSKLCRPQLNTVPCSSCLINPFCRPKLVAPEVLMLHACARPSSFDAGGCVQEPQLLCCSMPHVSATSGPACPVDFSICKCRRSTPCRRLTGMQLCCTNASPACAHHLERRLYLFCCRLSTRSMCRKAVTTQVCMYTLSCMHWL